MRACLGCGHGPHCCWANPTQRLGLGSCLPPSPSSAVTTSRKRSLTRSHGQADPCTRAPPAMRRCSARPCAGNLRPPWLVTWTPGPRAGSMSKREPTPGRRQGNFGVNGKRPLPPQPGQEAQSHGGGRAPLPPGRPQGCGGAQGTQGPAPGARLGAPKGGVTVPRREPGVRCDYLGTGPAPCIYDALHSRHPHPPDLGPRPQA